MKLQFAFLISLFLLIAISCTTGEGTKAPPGEDSALIIAPDTTTVDTVITDPIIGFMQLPNAPAITPQRFSSEVAIVQGPGLIKNAVIILNLAPCNSRDKSGLRKYNCTSSGGIANIQGICVQHTA